jgi:anaerobic magnesium-protoporphyrin IX monomethyl ester cyclase
MAPQCSLYLADLNLETWIWIAQQDPEGAAWLSFMRGEQEGFFEPAIYEAHQATWQHASRRMQALSLEASRLAMGTANTGALAEILTTQVQHVLAMDPDIVGISVMFLEQMPFALALAATVRSLADSDGPRQGGRPVDPRPRVVLGGAAMSAVVLDELLRQCPQVDAVLPGEGEAGFIALCRGAQLVAVPGVVLRDGRGGEISVPTSPYLALEQLPPPDFTDLLRLHYFNPSPVLPAVQSRGCRWRGCRFCAHNASFGPYRSKRPKAFVDELEGLAAKHGAHHFYLADQYLEPSVLAATADEILRRGLRFQLHAMGRPTAEYTPRLLERFAESGCVWMSWGVETGSQRLLDLVNKGTEVGVVKRVLRDAHDAGISNLVMLIFGLPTSTDEDFDSTLRFLEETWPYLDALTASAFVLFADTPLAQQASRYGLLVQGAHTIIEGESGAVHSKRLMYREAGSGKESRPPRASLEVAALQRRMQWLDELPLLNRLCAEHYLLHAGHRASQRCSTRLLKGVWFPS